MKKIVTTLIKYLSVLLVSMLVYQISYTCIGNRNIAKIIMMITFSLMSIVLIRFEGLQCFDLANYRIANRTIVMIVLVIMLFGVNNYIVSNSVHGSNFDYSEYGILFYILYFLITSGSEEIVYRGYVQNSIDSGTFKYVIGDITKGNLIASLLMAITHFGFFTVMSANGATYALLLVFLLSLTLGKVFNETKNIVLVIVIHWIVNLIHLSLHLIK